MSVPASSSVRPFSAVSHLLLWMAKRAAPLAGIAISIAALLWSDFRHEFGLPVSFDSSGMLAALPSLTAIVCVAVGSLVTGLAAPAMVLTYPLRESAPTLAKLCFPGESAPADSGAQKAARIIRRYWVGMGLISTIAWSAVITWTSIKPGTPVSAALLVLLAVILFQTALALPVLRHALSTRKPASAGFYGMLFFSLVLQAFVAFWTMYALLKSIVSLTPMEVIWRYVEFVAIMGATAVFQVLVAWRLTHGWYPNILKHAACLAILIIGAIGMIPPLGARVASYALLSTSTEGRPCTILLFRSAMKGTVLQTIVDSKHPSQSEALRFVFPSGNKLYVKESMTKPTYVVDINALVGTASCPNK